LTFEDFSFLGFDNLKLHPNTKVERML